MDVLWYASSADDLLYRAVAIVDDVAAGDFDRDKIRTEAFTKNVISRCSGMKHS